MNYAELNNRTRPTLKDLVLCLDEIIPIKSLEEYAADEIKYAIELKSEELLPRKNSTLQQCSIEDSFRINSYLEGDETEESPITKATPKNLPPFPPPHTYLQTKVKIINLDASTYLGRGF